MSQPVAFVGSVVEGMTAGEHHGHPVPHPPCKLTGVVVEGSGKIRSNGVFSSVVGMKVAEDDCCGAGVGVLGTLPRKLRINGIPVQTVTDSTVPHNGTAKVITGSPKIKSV